MPELHEAEQIQEAAIALIAAANIVNNQFVFGNRMLPFASPAMLPGIGIYLGDDDIDPESVETAPRNYKITSQLIIEAVCSYSDVVERELNALALEIEQAIEADAWLGLSHVSSVFPVSVERFVTPGGAKPVGVIRLLYNVIWYRYGRVAPVEDDLKSVHATFNLENSQAVADRLPEVVVEDLDSEE